MLDVKTRTNNEYVIFLSQVAATSWSSLNWLLILKMWNWFWIKLNHWLSSNYHLILRILKATWNLMIHLMFHQLLYTHMPSGKARHNHLTQWRWLSLLIDIQRQSCSRNNFAANLVRKVLVQMKWNSNYRHQQNGRNKRGCIAGEWMEVVWRSCCKAIDEFRRRLNRKTK